MNYLYDYLIIYTLYFCGKAWFHSFIWSFLEELVSYYCDFTDAAIFTIRVG